MKEKNKVIKVIKKNNLVKNKKGSITLDSQIEKSVLVHQFSKYLIENNIPEKIAKKNEIPKDQIENGIAAKYLKLMDKGIKKEYKKWAKENKIPQNLIKPVWEAYDND